jgi:hypothetical protein
VCWIKSWGQRISDKVVILEERSDEESVLPTEDGFFTPFRMTFLFSLLNCHSRPDFIGINYGGNPGRGKGEVIAIDSVAILMMNVIL